MALFIRAINSFLANFAPYEPKLCLLYERKDDMKHLNRPSYPAV